MADRNEWHAYVADVDGQVLTDPAEISSLLQHDGGTISIRRGSALPNQGGRLPGLDEHERMDLFGEIYLDDLEPDSAEQVWQLTQAATTGMNANLREQWAAVYADGDWTAGEHWSRAEAEEIIDRTAASRPVLARRWTSNWQHVETEVEQP